LHNKQLFIKQNLHLLDAELPALVEGGLGRFVITNDLPGFAGEEQLIDV
jgi:hypothetical protein